MQKKSSNNKVEFIIIKIVREKRPQTVKELTTYVKEELKISDQEIIESILKLQSDGKIKLEKYEPTPKNFITYLQAEQSYWYWITILISAATTIAVFTIPENLYPWVIIRHVLGAIFVLWLPGYTFIKLLFPTAEKAKEALDNIERIALSLGMSLALVPIIGLLLNYTPWGIRLTPIMISLIALTTVLATAALIREFQHAIKFANKLRRTD